MTFPNVECHAGHITLNMAPSEIKFCCSFFKLIHYEDINSFTVYVFQNLITYFAEKAIQLEK